MQRSVPATTTPREETPEPPVTSPSTSALAPSRPVAKVQAPLQPQDECEINIQVVIRCRRRSDREVQESSPIIVSTEGARSHAVSIETAAPVSSLGVVTLPPTRTYPFDLVFGPEADQSMIYQDVVHPMLEEVLLGYNCTLFAYGQTGTGKTYTMQGDLRVTPLGNPVATAGMIPRVLFRLFNQLEESGADYSVKISYIELYNEELRDLLASDLAAPMGNSQPMSMGSGNSRDAAAGGLKIFDDSSKRGVLIQGLEEISVKSAPDALALLVKGSDRRQIAATKFNDHSSRSHSIFSITVHTKEVSAMGDDLLRVGKLNLVDLAGSENIGRSGAENKRAREAGMINQSLLTLGRVINALVEKSSHIPYRESKLTRLLQDSLGGRTKTCIIATISPARSNMEETLSTLDYAIRAKSIRNRPEINQRMTRNSLLKEYVAEIERLKADLLAAREKNGIFFSEETWNQMSVEQELARTALEETKRQVETVVRQLKNIQEEYQQSMNLLTKRDGELKEAREELSETIRILTSTSNELQVTKSALEEEIIVRESYQTTEATLDEVARGLKRTAQESLGDLNAMFAKLSRKTSTLSANVETVLNVGRALTSETEKFSAELDVFIKNATQGLAKLRSDEDQYQVKELENLAGLTGRVNDQIQRVDDVMALIQVKDEVSAEALTGAQTAVKDAHDSMRAVFTSWADMFEKSSLSFRSDLEKSSTSGFQAVEKALNSIAALIQGVIQDSQEYMIMDRKHNTEVKSLAETQAEEQIRYLKEQNAQLTRLLQYEKLKSERMKSDLVERVSGLVNGFISERDNSLEEAVNKIKQQNGQVESILNGFTEENSRKADDVLTRNQELSTLLEKKGEQCKRLRDGAHKSLGSVSDTVVEGLSNMQSLVSTSLSTYSVELSRQTHVLNSTTTDAFERHVRAKRARIDATSNLGADIQAEYRHLQHAIAAMSRSVEANASKVTTETSKFGRSAQVYQKSTSERLDSMRKMTDSLVNQGSRQDVPTGSTPRKRVWQYTDDWELTEDRDAIIEAWKRKAVRSQTDESDSESSNTLLRIPQAPSSGSLKQPSLTSVATHPEDISDPPDPLPPPYLEADPAQPPASNLALPMASSIVPTIVLPSSVSNPNTKVKLGKSGSEVVPALGTLTERSTNLIYNRGTRRVR
ncbi:kinesin-domain-containing protein [Russula earlei]|uniref:Kinesin-domain-containing protein n=1 Tax=Russula earlei TaxID=71964 RepID=A0ACC0UGX9_9AGAM|nr:kinesin-domain-containing protein [Russula earlei]